jgi:hypothetical protein
MYVIVTRTQTITTQVEIREAVRSTKELKEVAIDQAKFQFANNDHIDYVGDGETFKIRAIV